MTFFSANPDPSEGPAAAGQSSAALCCSYGSGRKLILFSSGRYLSSLPLAHGVHTKDGRAVAVAGESSVPQSGRVPINEHEMCQEYVARDGGVFPGTFTLCQ